MRRTCCRRLAAFLAAGGSARSTPGTRRSRVVEVAFDDEDEAFANINTREELAGLEKAAMTSDATP